MRFKKLKNALKRIAYKIDAIFLKMFGERLFAKKKFERVHLSLDDCWEVLINNRGGVYQWFISSNLFVHIFVFYRQGENCLKDFELNRLPNNIVIAPHSTTDFIECVKLLRDKGYAISDSVRFHNWSATRKELLTAKEFGITTFLCCDKQRVSYDLSNLELKALSEKGALEIEGRTYIKTNVRLERLVFFQLLKCKSRSLVIFGHEWAWDNDKERLQIIVDLIKKHNLILF